MNLKNLIRSKGKQPVARITTEELHFLINREFPEHFELIKSKLDQIDSYSYSESEENRIAAAVLKLAGRDINKIDGLIRSVNYDYRDVISAAEYPRVSSYDFGERSEDENKIDYIKDWEEYCEWKNQGMPKKERTHNTGLSKFLDWLRNTGQS